MTYAHIMNILYKYYVKEFHMRWIVREKSVYIKRYHYGVSKVTVLLEYFVISVHSIRVMYVLLE